MPLQKQVRTSDSLHKYLAKNGLLRKFRKAVLFNERTVWDNQRDAGRERDTVNGAFTWKNTADGHDFWSAHHTKFRDSLGLINQHCMS